MIFDDEPRNQEEVLRHPEREAIEAASAVEIQQLVDQKVGVEAKQGEKYPLQDGIRAEI